jgi:hypothetical protein
MTTKVAYITKCDKCGFIRIKGVTEPKLMVKINGKDYCYPECLKKIMKDEKAKQ